MEKESVRSVAIQYVKLMAGLALVLFNLWHLAKSQADKQNSNELQLLRAEFVELKQSLDEIQLRREKAKSNFDLFLESRENK